MKKYELRKQPKEDYDGKQIQVIRTELFRSKLGELLNEKRSLQKTDDQNHYYIFINHNTKEKK